MIRLFLLIISLQLIKFSLLAQIAAPEKIGLEKGLSQGMIYAIMQDKQGFLWIGTKDGLNRYDGYNFKIFTKDLYNEKSISGNTCTALLEDSKGRIWVGTETDGLNLYDPKTQQFFHAKIEDKDVSKAGNYSVRNLIEDKTGNIWVIAGLMNKLFKVPAFNGYPSKTEFTSNIQHMANKELPSVADWIFYKNFIFNNDEILPKKSVRWKEKINPKENYVDLVLYGYNNDVWLTNYWSILYCSNTTVKKIPIHSSDNIMFANFLSDTSIAIIGRHHIWIMTQKELLQLDSFSIKNAYAKIGPENQRADFAFKDVNNNIWVSTRGYGLYKLNTKLQAFKSYLEKNSLNTIFEDQDKNVLILGNFTPHNVFYKFNKTLNKLESIKSIEQKRFGPNYSLAQDAQKNYWLLVSNGLKKSLDLVKYDPKFNFIKQYFIDSSYGDVFITEQIILDKNNELNIGLTNNKIIKFNIKTEKKRSFDYESVLPKEEKFLNLQYLYLDGKNNLWICTKKGLLKMDPNNKFTYYGNNPKDRNSLNYNFTSSCIDDKRDNNLLWISTKGGGINLLNKTTGAFKHFTSKDGLCNNVVYGLVIDADSNLWMSTNKGIARLNTLTYNFSNYGKEDGLQENEFNTNSFLAGQNKLLYFGGINGLTIVNPEILKTIKPNLNIKIVGLKINNQTTDITQNNKVISSAIEYLPALNLKYNENQISIESSLLDFSTPEINRYKYQLVGIDKDWVDAGTDRFANYAQLPSGHYIFKVKGTSNGEIWSDPIQLEINIAPPWYRSWWAYLIYLAGIIYMFWWWYKNQINKVRLREQIVYKEKEAKQLAELDQVKTNFFSNISHEIRTPLTLILGPSQALSQGDPKNQMYQLIFRNAKRMLELINQILDISKLDAGQMKVQLQEKELVEYFKLQLKNFSNAALEKNIVLELQQNKNSIIGFIDDDKVSKIMSNLLSNALKFTPINGAITVTVAYLNNDTTMRISVKDNGIGIPKEKLDGTFNRFFQTNQNEKVKNEGTGLGLALVKELTELMNGNVSLESELNKGTTIIVNLPITDI